MKPCSTMSPPEQIANTPDHFGQPASKANQPERPTSGPHGNGPPGQRLGRARLPCLASTGPRRPPHTPLGWLTMELLRIRAWRVDPFDITGWAGTGHLTGPLPVRQGAETSGGALSDPARST